MSTLHFDVMIDDKFVCTMHMPIPFDMVVGYNKDRPIVNLGIDGGIIKDFVIQQRPSLKNKNFNIAF